MAVTGVGDSLDIRRVIARPLGRDVRGYTRERRFRRRSPRRPGSRETGARAHDASRRESVETALVLLARDRRRREPLPEKLGAGAGPLRLVSYRRFCNLVLSLRACDERTDGTALKSAIASRVAQPRALLTRKAF